MASCSRLLHGVSQLWESLQVELQGQYSIQRMLALRQYEENTSWLRAVGVALLMPLPCLVLILGIDAMPLLPIEVGFNQQNLAFWIRMFAFGFITAFSMMVQFIQVVPALPMSTCRLWFISAFVGVALFPVSYALSVGLGFPVPFAIQLQTSPFIVFFGTALWISWRHTLRHNSQAKADLGRWFLVLQPQITLVLVYTGFNLAFNQLSGTYQVLFTGVLPVIKLGYKNWVGWRVFHLEDMAPSIVVFSVDVFHTLYVSLTMQQAQTIGSTVVVFAVDVVQSMIAYYEISKELRRVAQLSRLIHKLNKAASSSCRRSTAGIDLSLGGVNYAIRILEMSEPLRANAEIVEPRHRRASSVARFASISLGPAHNAIAPSPPPATKKYPSTTAELEETQAQCVQSVLKLLHMTEFYMLVEFAEVMMAAIYATYLLVLSVLPNRVYYTQLSHLSSAEIQHTASHVAVYAVLELVSFIVFCAVVSRKLHHFSVLRQLGFVLETHWRLVQAIFVMWVFTTVQFTLVHFGTDYTFQFKWLRKEQHD